ncbi:MAG TPA: thioredoxin domain-containing protein, partial [Pseudodesulfovibrio sp.]|nr:thioredoxin domain-containing protein [Pseudodesulfovibrio sp.]
MGESTSDTRPPTPPADLDGGDLPRDGGERYNRLIFEKSPYLLQHAENPVDWFPWGEEAFTRARQEDKPIFLSIGYSTCHWCHVMAHESFADLEVAALLNRHFVAVKVDREERPDIDATFMAACQIMTGSGGWPLTVVLTPQRQP